MVELLQGVSGVGFIVSFLKAQYAVHGETAVVGSKIRDPRPAKFTKVRQMNSNRPDVARFAPTINFECWATDSVVAEQLGILTEALVNALPDLSPDCTRVVEVGGLYDQVDDVTGTPRWIFTKVLYLRSTVLV